MAQFKITNQGFVGNLIGTASGVFNSTSSKGYRAEDLFESMSVSESVMKLMIGGVTKTASLTVGSSTRSEKLGLDDTNVLTSASISTEFSASTAAINDLKTELDKTANLVFNPASGLTLNLTASFAGKTASASFDASHTHAEYVTTASFNTWSGSNASTFAGTASYASDAAKLGGKEANQYASASHVHDYVDTGSYNEFSSSVASTIEVVSEQYPGWQNQLVEVHNLDTGGGWEALPFNNSSSVEIVFTSGTVDGAFNFTLQQLGGSGTKATTAVHVAGLKSAAFTESDAYDTAGSAEAAAVRAIESASVAITESFTSTYCGVSGGFAPLDANRRIPVGYLPSLSGLMFGGTFDGHFEATITNNLQSKLNITDTKIQLLEGATDYTGSTPKEYGYKTLENVFFICEYAAEFAGIVFETGDWLISIGTGWKKIDSSDAVTGVKGSFETTYRQGSVDLTIANFSASMADGTSGTLEAKINEITASVLNVSSSSATYIESSIASLNATTASFDDGGRFPSSEQIKVEITESAGVITGIAAKMPVMLTTSSFNEWTGSTTSSYSGTASYASNAEKVGGKTAAEFLDTASFNTWTGSTTSTFAGTASYASVAATASYAEKIKTSTAVGSTTQPVYVAANGEITAATAYESASVWVAQTASYVSGAFGASMYFSSTGELIINVPE